MSELTFYPIGTGVYFVWFSLPIPHTYLNTRSPDCDDKNRKKVGEFCLRLRILLYLDPLHIYLGQVYKEVMRSCTYLVPILSLPFLSISSALCRSYHETHFLDDDDDYSKKTLWYEIFLSLYISPSLPLTSGLNTTLYSRWLI